MTTEYTSIDIGEDKDSYKMPVNLLQIATYIEYLDLNSTRDLKYISKKLGLDTVGRNKHNNTIKSETTERRQRSLRIINKGLSFELLACAMFRYFDQPSVVHSNCKVKHFCDEYDAYPPQMIAVPHNFAQTEVPDSVIEYDDYMILLEVSAKYQPSLEFYKTQLEAALRHTRKLKEDRKYKKPIYCLLINERPLHYIENKEAMRAISAEILSSEKIYLIGLSTVEFARLGQIMAQEYPDILSNISSKDLHEVLKSTAKMGVNGKFDEAFVNQLELVNQSNLSFDM